MDAFLGKITQHAMNYAIRSGIGITASFAISQTSRLLKTVEDNGDYRELHGLQERLDSKIRIISPAIDMIDLISARGNTTLESAVTLTKALRWDIQALGVRLEKAASAEESSRRKSTRANSRASHEVEIRQIVLDIRKLLTRIEDAVPLINLAITTSGARLSTTLPTSVSPSRLLQASTFLTAGDTRYSMSPNQPVQVGPSFTLSLYMLFAGHWNRLQEDFDNRRDTTWKEVIHKARVKIMRTPLHEDNSALSNTPILQSVEDGETVPVMVGEGKVNEFSYHIKIIEDLNDDRAHSFEEGEPQPGPYEDIQLAGIRDILPIHQISKIFYADTGKILNIGNQGETNNPVLLLKRDINALPPRRMMQESEKVDRYYVELEEEEAPVEEASDDSQDDIDQQLRRESSVHIQPLSEEIQQQQQKANPWGLPADLDPEWLALEVYTEAEESESEDEQDINDDSAYVSHRPSSSGQEPSSANLTEHLSNLNIEEQNSPSPSPAHQVASSTTSHKPSSPNTSPFGPIRSSLSLLEMLIRLTALQQFQQTSHLSIPDELLTFFLEESSTTGAGGNGDERRRTRREARQKVGFDPYDESPVKRHGEDYQYQYQNQGQTQEFETFSREGTPWDERYEPHMPSPRWSGNGSRRTPQASPEPSWLRSRDSPAEGSKSATQAPSSPMSPYRTAPKSMRPLERVQMERRGLVSGSPLGRGVSAESDSTLGTSPGLPSLGGGGEKDGK